MMAWFKMALLRLFEDIPERIILIDYVSHVISFGQGLVGEVIIGVEEEM